jgi:putative transposase
MPYRNVEFTQGQYYHIYNRGAGRSKIFFVEENYKYLTRLVERNFKKYGIIIIAYCFMPNHYHFLLRLENELFLSKFINVLFSAYVQALNRQQNRTGTLFEGRFKHILVDEWKYLIHLCRYIHLNPVKAGLVSAPEEWEYSNYKEWIGARNGILKDEGFIKDYFESREKYSEFVNDVEDEKQSLAKIGKYIWD